MSEKEFIHYCWSFYGPGQIYDLGATPAELARALEIRIKKFPDLEFAADSVDRELVRDVMLSERGKV